MSRCGLFCGPLGHDVFCRERVEARAMSGAKKPWDEEWRTSGWCGPEDGKTPETMVLHSIQIRVPYAKPPTSFIPRADELGDDKAREVLAASAPDLYRALLAMVLDCGDMTRPDERNIEAARRALRKARGE